jgi:hypothetical protein
MEVSPRASQAMQEGIRAHSGLDLLVVSHACVVPSNQGVFRCLRERGTLLKLVVPDRWSDAYRDEAFQPSALDGMEDAILPARTVGVGRAQRYAYMRNPMRILRRLRPKLLLIEEESYSLAALQWGMAATMSRVDFGVQAAETIDRSSWPARRRPRTSPFGGVPVVRLPSSLMPFRNGTDRRNGSPPADLRSAMPVDWCPKRASTTF